MRTLIKFTFGWFVIGALAMLGSALFQAPAGRAHSPALVGDALLGSAFARIDAAIRQASVQLGPAFRSIPIRSRAFARSNALEARMEFDTMASSLLTSEWLRGRMLYWIKSEVQGTTLAKRRWLSSTACPWSKPSSPTSIVWRTRIPSPARHRTSSSRLDLQSPEQSHLSFRGNQSDSFCLAAQLRHPSSSDQGRNRSGTFMPLEWRAKGETA
jgi:hypothetical protein